MKRRTLTWIDIGNYERVTQLSSVFGCPDTYDAIVPLSNSSVKTWHEGDVQFTGTGAGPVAAYASGSTALIMQLLDGLGFQSELFIPAPSLSVLRADLITMDTLNGDVASLVADLGDLWLPYSGAQVAQVTGGVVANNIPSISETYANYRGTVTWNRIALVWSDTQGRRYFQMLANRNDVGNPPSWLLDISSSMQALSTAHFIQYWQGPMQNNYPVTPTIDQYNSVKDYAACTFADAQGNETLIVLPAPNRVLFLADGKTINRAQVNFATFITAVIAECVVPSSGQPITQFLGGQLRTGERD